MSFQSRPFLSQRFAVDLLRFSPEGYLAKPGINLETLSNEDFYCFGEKIYAVADAQVFNSRDGLPDIIPGVLPPPNLDNADGNFVILEIAYDSGKGLDTVYANYAHLKQGSIKVKIGDKVKKGDVIGLLGNSGNTTGPHLHFHMFAKGGFGILTSQGLPYTINSFNLKGIILNPEQLDASLVRWQVESKNEKINLEMPALNQLIDF